MFRVTLVFLSPSIATTFGYGWYGWPRKGFSCTFLVQMMWKSVFGPRACENMFVLEEPWSTLKPVPLKEQLADPTSPLRQGPVGPSGHSRVRWTSEREAWVSRLYCLADCPEKICNRTCDLRPSEMIFATNQMSLCVQSSLLRPLGFDFRLQIERRAHGKHDIDFVMCKMRDPLPRLWSIFSYLFWRQNPVLDVSLLNRKVTSYLIIIQGGHVGLSRVCVKKYGPFDMNNCQSCFTSIMLRAWRLAVLDKLVAMSIQELICRVVFFITFFLPVPVTMWPAFPDVKVWDREEIQHGLDVLLVFCCFIFQEVSARAVDNANFSNTSDMLCIVLLAPHQLSRIQGVPPK